MLTVEEVKKLRHKQNLKKGRDKFLLKEKAMKAEREQEFWMEIYRYFTYLGKDFWREMSEERHKKLSEWWETPVLFWSENEISDVEFINGHKYDWFRDWSRFWVSWYNGYVSQSNARDRWEINSCIKLVSTASLQKIYNNYIDWQHYIRHHLEELAKERGMSVRDFVKWGFRYEDLIKGRRGYWRTRRATYKPAEWSWLEKVMADVSFKYRITWLDYIRMIYEDRFMLNEALVPFKTYIVWDYILFGNKACAVPSMFWNWEYFNQENRETIHHWWRYALRVNPDYNIANKVPIFTEENMKIIKVIDEKIYDKDDKVWHSNWHYSFYLVSESEKLAKVGIKDRTMEEIINKFHTPSTDVMELKEMKPKTEKEEMSFNKKLKQNVFYFEDY